MPHPQTRSMFLLKHTCACVVVVRLVYVLQGMLEEPGDSLLVASDVQCVDETHPPPPLVADPVPLPAPAARAGGRVDPTNRATAILEVPGGLISYYAHTNRFTAVCKNPLHGIPGECTLSRLATRRAHMRGRPVAFMAEFLARADASESKVDHWSCLDIIQDPDILTRRREAIVASPEGLNILSYERQLAPGE